MAKWFMAFNHNDVQLSDSNEAGAFYGPTDFLNGYPYPVKAEGAIEAGLIAEEWDRLGDHDDVGSLAIIRGSRTCWLERLA